MAKPREIWRQLRIGDRIRLVEIPTDLDWGALLPETKQAYRYLVERRRPLTVFMIDEYGFPWIRFWFRRRNGQIRHDWLAINHGGLAIVKARKKTRGK